MEQKLKSKDLLGLADVSAQEITLVLDTADSMKQIVQRTIKKVPTLRGRTILNLFYEPSTRTRSAFELAAKYLSADSISIATATSSITKGETLKDTAKNVEAMGIELIIMRHPVAGAPHYLAENVSASVINAGDGMHEHPTQGLLDIYTMREHKGRIEGLKVAIIGDIMHSRVARSNIWGLKKLGADIILSGPPTLLPKEMAGLGVNYTYSVEEAIRDADVVNVLRLQKERQDAGYLPSLAEYHKYWGVTKERLALAKPDALLMHPGPMNRGIEITSEIADGKQSAILDQVTNGVAIRMALFYLMLGGKEDE